MLTYNQRTNNQINSADNLVNISFYLRKPSSMSEKQELGV